MSKKISTVGTIVSPNTPPEAGFYESLSFLDENGYFHDTQNHLTAMARAGLRCVNSRADHAAPIFTVSMHPDGLFTDGIGPLGRDLLQILAYEGFEGEVRDMENGMVYILAGGALKEHSHYDRDSVYDESDVLTMVA
ncbi:hypothetical protein G6L37_00695 [Agrobacterium rubi]|nr:hypothetical protein [Agrobacterium rubi]NTF23908.1 hypothetical protein [Agrobacterium rubi]